MTEHHLEFLSLKGGCTGSSVSTLVNMPHSWKSHFAALIKNTSPNIFQAADTIVDPYNAVLTANEMLQHADVTFCFDNEALYRIWFKTLKLTRSPEYEDLNHFIALALSGVTSSFRFPAQLNVDMDNLIGNMVPEPTLHFLMPVFAPLFPRDSKGYPSPTLIELTQALYDPGHVMTSCNPRKGRYITLSTIFRGKVGAKDVSSELLKVRHELDKNFVEWFPHNIKTDTLDIPTYGSRKSSTLISNSTSIQVRYYTTTILCFIYV